MKNLVLIGMPGAGKSTVGVVLAKQQGYHFVDSDLVIQEKTGLLLHEIIEQQGDDGFAAGGKPDQCGTGSQAFCHCDRRQRDLWAGSHAAFEKNRCCDLSEAVVRIHRSASGRFARTRHYAAGGTDAAAALR